MTQVPPRVSLLAGHTEWPMWFVAVAVMTGVGALMSIWIGRHHSIQAKVLWTIVALWLPIIGPLAWFLLGRERWRANG